MFRGGRNCINKHFCRFHGGRHPDRGDFSHGIADVSGCNAADCQRLRLLAAVEGRSIYEHCGMESTEGDVRPAEKAVQNPGITKRSGS